MALGIRSSISTLNCWARVWLDLVHWIVSLHLSIFASDCMILYYKSILYLQPVCHGASRSQHVNENTTCSVGVTNWKGKCQPLPENLWKILFLASCSPLSSTIQLFFGWRSAVTAKDRHQHKQQSLLKLWSFCQSESTVLWSTYSVLPPAVSQGLWSSPNHPWLV